MLTNRYAGTGCLLPFKVSGGTACAGTAPPHRGSVSDELLDDALMRLDRGAARIVVGVHGRAYRLRVHGFRHGRRPDQIAEERGDDAAARGRTPGRADRGSARRTKV